MQSFFTVRLFKTKLKNCNHRKIFNFSRKFESISKVSLNNFFLFFFSKNTSEVLSIEVLKWKFYPKT